MSIGIGKMMVLLFSAEMLFSVCRYRSWKIGYDDHDDHDDDDRDEDEDERRKEMSSRFYNLILHLRLAAMHSFNSPLALQWNFTKTKMSFSTRKLPPMEFHKNEISYSTPKLPPMEFHQNQNVIFNPKTATNGHT